MIIRPSKTPKARVSGTSSIAAPTGGLNARDAIADMPEEDAVIMTNWFPSPSSVGVRRGYATHATGLLEPVETLMTYNTGAAKEIYGIADGEIYDVTTAGAVGAAVVSSLTNSRFEYITMGTAGGYFLLAVNGADKLQGYDGSAWWEDGDGAHDITGVDTADIAHINNFKNRVWMIEKDTLAAWYLPVASIAGAATKFDLSGLFKLGGSLMIMENWTIDNANGVDDYAAFITSEGEVALYKGTDPSSANTWALVGTFRMGRPIGRRCAIKVAADVLLITTDGAFPLSKSLLTDRTQSQAAVTDKITNLFKPDIRDNSTKFGWQPILYPFGNKLVINVPTVENSVSHQWVMNTINGSWCRFEGWNANCWETLDDDLYFGGDGTVYKADTGEDDNGENIESDVQQAFSYFGSKGQIKKFTLAKPHFMTSGEISPALVLNVDFQSRTPSAPPSFSSPGVSLWDVAPWDTSSWAFGDTIVAKWQGITGVGFCGAIRIQTAIKDLSVAWVSTDFLYEKGGVL